MSRYLLLLVSLSLLTGCTTLTKTQLNKAETRQKEAAKTITSFGKAVADDDVEAAMALISPYVSSSRRQNMRQKIRRATWLRLYTGCAFQGQKAVKGLSLGDWLDEKVQLPVPVASKTGPGFREQVELQRSKDNWKIADFTLESPKRGADVDLPEEKRKALMKTVSEIIQKLKEEKYAEIYYSLPEQLRFRKKEVGLWNSLWGGGPHSFNVYDDLKNLKDVTVHHWPDPHQHLPTAYYAPEAVMVIYKLPYSWPARGISDDELRVEMLMSRKPEQNKTKWKMISIRLYGKAIPGTEQ